MKRKIGRFLLGLLLVLVVGIGIAALLARLVPSHPYFDNGQVLVMAHRGGRGLRPENTLVAFQEAVALGVDVLEMDLHSTSDGVVVVMHDDTVDRTTDGSGPVHDYSLAELQVLDAGYHWSADDGATTPYRGLGIGVPTLEEVFTAFPGILMNIEIKQAQPAIVAPVCQLIRDHGMAVKVLVASFDDEIIKAFRRTCPEVATTAGEDEVRLLYGLSLVYLGGLLSPAYEAVQVPEYSGNIHVLTQRFVDAAHGRNLQVHAWTINEVADMQRLLDLGVDGIITDYPDRLLRLLGR
jgi:glycerophosphoryl diester phosphodiesterase